MKGNYRRVFLDMHIDDSDEEYLSKLDEEHIVNMMKECGAQLMVVKGRPHTGVALYPTKFGRMHRGLKGKDYFGRTIRLCHENGIAVQAYFSQIFDNWAYDNHPEWRVINGEGKSSRETEDYENPSLFRRGRYGIVCPNNEEYREYAVNCLKEMTENYSFESIFMDMGFWDEVCYCPSCRKKYFEATGREMPQIVDWESEEFREWQKLREMWLGEFVQLTSNAVKSVRPEVMIEQNLSMMVDPWVFAHTERVSDTSDYAGGDFYGGYMEESFISKFFRNITKREPFEFITSRCEPALFYHTTTKSEDELLLHSMIALMHNGAISVCDGMNPDGTIVDDFYKGTMKNVFCETQKFTEYVGGKLRADVGIWYPTRLKGSDTENGNQISKNHLDKGHVNAKINMAKILRQEHISFDVVPSNKIETCENQLLIISNVMYIDDASAEAIEKYIMNGGNVYISGAVKNPKLLQMMEAKSIGYTEHNVTYMTPVNSGKMYFEGFDKTAPLNIQAKQALMEFDGEYEVLAQLTLPHTMTGKREFSSIHSNPPGIHTEHPVVVRKRIGKGTLLWTSAMLENQTPYMTKMTTVRLLKSMINTQLYEVKAPACAEVISWEKDEKIYYGVLNEQEQYPFIPVNEMKLTIKEKINRAIDLRTGEALKVTKTENDLTEIVLPELNVFHMIMVE